MEFYKHTKTGVSCSNVSDNIARDDEMGAVPHLKGVHLAPLTGADPMNDAWWFRPSMPFITCGCVEAWCSFAHVRPAFMKHNFSGMEDHYYFGRSSLHEMSALHPRCVRLGHLTSQVQGQYG